MMARWHEAIFPTLEELGVGFVAFSPLANGFLTGAYNAASKFDAKTDYRAAMPQFSKESYDKNHDLLATLSQISLAWMLCKKPWIVPIPGTRHLCRLKENLGAADIHLTPSEIEAIDHALDTMPMSDVFGGAEIRSKPHA